MHDDTSEQKKRKHAYVASTLIAFLSLAGVIAVVILNPAAERKAAVPPPGTERAAVEQGAIVVAAPAVLGRAELLAATRAAASTFASQGTLGVHTKMLQRRFSVRIAFGCYEDGNNAGQTSLTFSADNKSAMLAATPADWTNSLLVLGLSGQDGIEAVEGFWLPRTWTDAESCPPKTNYIQPLSPTPPTTQSAGLAQLFTVETARVARHSEKPYLFSRKLPAGDPELRNHHYFLLLEGRITGFPDGNDLHCWMEGADHRPVCLFGVEFENVAFEDAVSGKTLASWHP